MTNDIDEIVRELRATWYGGEVNSRRPIELRAADALERLLLDLSGLERLKAERDALALRIEAADRTIANISIALGGTDEWSDAEVMDYYVINLANEWKVRAEAAEKEMERLRGLFQQYRRYFGGIS